MQWVSDSKAQPKQRAEGGLPAQRSPPSLVPSGRAEAVPGQSSFWGGRNSVWRAQGQGAGEPVRGSGGCGSSSQLHTRTLSRRYQAAESGWAAPSSSSAAPESGFRLSRSAPH